jgi:hypothetical protein
MKRKRNIKTQQVYQGTRQGWMFMVANKSTARTTSRRTHLLLPGSQFAWSSSFPSSTNGTQDKSTSSLPTLKPTSSSTCTWSCLKVSKQGTAMVRHTS